MENHVPDSFNPTLRDPLYFMRRGLLQAIRDNAKHLTGRIMDFGCGAKPYLSLFNHVDEYIGVDYQGEGHDHTKEEVDVYYDGRKLPFPDDYFDGILSSEVFEHLFNLDEIMAELNRVLKPGGKMLFTCPFVWNLHEEPVDYARYTPYALSALLTKNGFETIQMQRIGTGYMTLAQMEILVRLNSDRILYSALSRTWLLNNSLWNFRLFYRSALIIYLNLKGLLMNSINKDPHPTWYLSNVGLVKK